MPASRSPFQDLPLRGWSVLLLLLVFAGMLLLWVLLPDPQAAEGILQPGMVRYEATYCTVEGVDLKLDAFAPRTPGPWAALVYVHGGGWTYGDKAHPDFIPPDTGALVVSINYRLAPEASFPEMVADVRCALRYLRAHARQYNLDPRRIALMGHSAGGNLAALAALAGRQPDWDAGPWREYSSRVQALVVIGAPSDLLRPFPPWSQDLVDTVFAGGWQDNASPVLYATPGDPPVLILHGAADAVVPVEQAYLLQAALLDAGVPVEMTIVENGAHGLEPAGGKPASPSLDEVLVLIRQFLDEHLKR